MIAFDFVNFHGLSLLWYLLESSVFVSPIFIKYVLRIYPKGQIFINGNSNSQQFHFRPNCIVVHPMACTKHNLSDFLENIVMKLTLIKIIRALT